MDQLEPRHARRKPSADGRPWPGDEARSWRRGTDRRHQVNPAATNVPPFIELISDTSASTIHFPRGLYQLESEDNHGYYYRSQVKVYQRNYLGRTPYEGGISVSKKNQRPR